MARTDVVPLYFARLRPELVAMMKDSTPSPVVGVRNSDDAIQQAWPGLERSDAPRHFLFVMKSSPASKALLSIAHRDRCGSRTIIYTSAHRARPRAWC